MHRYYRDHVPACLQLFINEKLKEIVKIGELMAVEKEPTSVEYRLYVREQDEKQSRKSDLKGVMNTYGKTCWLFIYG